MTTFRETNVSVYTSSSPDRTMSLLVLFETHFDRWQFLTTASQVAFVSTYFNLSALRRPFFLWRSLYSLIFIIHTSDKLRYTTANWHRNSPRTQRCVFRVRRIEYCGVHTFRLAYVNKFNHCLNMHTYDSGPATKLILDLYYFRTA